MEPETLSLEAAVDLLKAQEAKGKKRKGSKGRKTSAKPKNAAVTGEAGAAKKPTKTKRSDVKKPKQSSGAKRAKPAAAD